MGRYVQTQAICTQLANARSPIASAKGEIKGTLYRARHLINIAKESLAPIPQTATDDEANKRTIVKQPLGVVV